jgi:hypothetical protein
MGQWDTNRNTAVVVACVWVVWVCEERSVKCGQFAIHIWTKGQRDRASGRQEGKKSHWRSGERERGARMRWLQGVGWSMRIDPNDSARLHPRKIPGQVGRGTVNPDFAWEGSDLSVCAVCVGANWDGTCMGGWSVCEWTGERCMCEDRRGRELISLQMQGRLPQESRVQARSGGRAGVSWRRTRCHRKNEKFA